MKFTIYKCPEHDWATNHFSGKKSIRSVQVVIGKGAGEI